jgi:hypothetical protein
MTTDRFRVDLYADGHCVYRLDRNGEIASIEAWARNALIARAAYDALIAQYPQEWFSLRHRGFVTDERIAKP